MALFFIGLSLLFLMLGLIADMLTRLYYGLHIGTPYEIRQTFENPPESPETRDE
jgi:hypothetical protein